jgi:hypothetical protein
MVSPDGCSHCNTHTVSKRMERDLHVDRLFAFSRIRKAITVRIRIAALLNEAGQIRPKTTEILLHPSVAVRDCKFPTNEGYVQPGPLLGRLPENSGVMKP